MISLNLWLGLAFCVCVYLLWTRRKYYLLMLKLNGPMGYPLIGMALKLRKKDEIIQILYKYQQIYGSLFLSWLGPFPFLVTSEPQIAQDILTSAYCVNKSLIYDAVADGTGRGLFSSKNPTWSAHRKLLNPAFGHNILLSFLPIFNREVNVLLDDLDSLVGRGEHDLTAVLQKFTLNVATMTTMGKNAENDNNITSQKESLFKSYHCVLEKMTAMCFAPWMHFRVVHWLMGGYFSYVRAKLEIRTFIRNMIYKRLKLSESVPATEDQLSQKTDHDNSDIRKNNKNIFIDIAIDLLKRGEFSWNNVVDESNVIVFGAFETTANTIGYTLMLLAMFPKYQQRAFEEIKTLFPQRDDLWVTYEDTQQMVYMDMVLNETMRLFAPVPAIARQNTHDLQLSNGVVLPQGLQITIDIFNMHRRVDIWGPDANIFNPDNFLPSNMDGKHPFAFIPFTKGIRNCIGMRYALMSTKVTLARLLRKYRYTTSFNFQDLHFVEDITLKFKKTPLLELHLRDS